MNQVLSPSETVQSHEPPHLLSSSAEAGQILDKLQQAPKIIADSEVSAPFHNYRANTDEVWQHVPEAAINDYLKDRFFFDTHLIKDKQKLAFIESDSQEEPIDIPLDLVVCARGFKDWSGRDPAYDKSWASKFGYGHMKSLDVIKHYAGLSTELPPVGVMHMFVQPDGKIFFDNSSGDSHRIAAAVLRGEKSIETTALGVYSLDRDYI